MLSMETGVVKSVWQIMKKLGTDLNMQIGKYSVDGYGTINSLYEKVISATN